MFVSTAYLREADTNIQHQIETVLLDFFVDKQNLNIVSYSPLRSKEYNTALSNNPFDPMDLISVVGPPKN